ncbi:hypothetical protein BBIA_1097 [Bifidobacterium biavatii DSM 23969]|uniref:Uncharacterized protein n=1 Tax=Bifidobacterium biavatii DSM 23969 TaxID=1437608 RepID=A0A086ZLS1_9BIFI|nr:hypothetical protein BBIA_1097 [Bifidobacterium biavatii DSM 23969]
MPTFPQMNRPCPRSAGDSGRVMPTTRFFCRQNRSEHRHCPVHAQKEKSPAGAGLKGERKEMKKKGVKLWTLRSQVSYNHTFHSALSINTENYLRIPNAAELRPNPSRRQPKSRPPSSHAHDPRAAGDGTPRRITIRTRPRIIARHPALSLIIPHLPHSTPPVQRHARITPRPHYATPALRHACIAPRPHCASSRQRSRPEAFA